MYKILVVCMGNICRSPMAQVVMQTLVNRAGHCNDILIDSAGTHAQHLGENMDPRAQTALLRRGYEVGNFKSRRIVAADFARFDAILAMDTSNFANLARQCPSDLRTKVQHFLASDSRSPIDVPDPYYGNAFGFEHVLDMCESGARQWIAWISQKTATDKLNNQPSSAAVAPRKTS